MYTNPEGSITLKSNISGETKTHTDYYQDGISPALLSLSVLERLDTATVDRVYLQFSEPISAPGLAWPLALFDASGNPLDITPSVTSSKLYNEALNVWEYTISFDANGNSLITEGMKGQLLASA